MQKVPWIAEAVSTKGAAPKHTHIDTVELLVRDLESMSAFYQHAVTLDVLDEKDGSILMGRAGIPVLLLRQEKDLPYFNKKNAGLYHTAFLFQDQERLASALAAMAQHASDKYEGAADHLVSEAFYFHDPEGNGIEIYRDKPRSEWPLVGDGTVNMGSHFLDPNVYLQKWYNPEAITDDASLLIGHVHLQVGNVAQAKEFYSNIVGFDVMQDVGNALFVSAGGYHHHIGLNSWNSFGAGPRAASLGLGDVRLVIPTREDIAELDERLRSKNIQTADDGKTLRFEDPWGTQISVSPSF